MARKTTKKTAAKKAPTKKAPPTLPAEVPGVIEHNNDIPVTPERKRPHAGNLPDLSAAVMLRMTALNLSLNFRILVNEDVLGDEERAEVDRTIADAEFLAQAYERQANSR